MQIEGKKYICDRCKLESFVIKKETLVVDGGYTRKPTFEIAEGWTRQNRGNEWCDLCPTCSEKLQDVIDKFWEKEVGRHAGIREDSGRGKSSDQ